MNFVKIKYSKDYRKYSFTLIVIKGVERPQYAQRYAKSF